MGKIKVTLVKSLIGVKPKTKLNAVSMGLTKIGDSKIFVEDASVAGKLRVISYLVKTEIVES